MFFRQIGYNSSRPWSIDDGRCDQRNAARCNLWVLPSSKQSTSSSLQLKKWNVTGWATEQSSGSTAMIKHDKPMTLGFPWVPNFETAQRQYVWCGFQPSSGIGSGHHKSKFLGVNRYYEYVQRPRKINMYFQDGIDGIDAFRLCCMYLYMSMYIYIYIR